VANETVEIRIRATTDQAQKAMESLAASGVRVKKAFVDVGDAAPAATRATTAYAAAVDAARLRTEAYADRLGATGAVLKALGPAGTAAAGGAAILGAAYLRSAREAAEFNKTLANVSAITGQTGRDLDVLRQKAIEFSRDSTQSARDVAEAFKLVASAKPELLENADALAKVTKEVITLSEASGLGLAEAARATTNALSQFGAGADQAARFVNVLAAGAKFGKAEIPELTDALVKSGAVAASVGVSFEQTVATLEKLAEFGAPAEEFATGFRNVLLKLGAGADETNPKVVGLTQALLNLGAKGFTISDLAQEFGDRNAVVAAQMIQTANAAEVLRGKVTGTGAAYEQAKANTDTLLEQLTRLGNAFVNLGLQIQGSQRGLTDGVREITEWVNTFAAGLERAQNIVDRSTLLRVLLVGGAGAAIGSRVGAPGAVIGAVALGIGEYLKATADEAARTEEALRPLEGAAVRAAAGVNQVAAAADGSAAASSRNRQGLGELADGYRTASPLAQALTVASLNLAQAFAGEAEAARLAALEEKRLAEARASARVAFGDSLGALRRENESRRQAAAQGLSSEKTDILVAARETGFQTKNRSNALAFAIEANERLGLVAATKEQDKALRDLGKTQQSALKDAQENIRELKAEAEARREGVAAGLSTIEIEAKVAGAKALVKTGNQEVAQATEAAALAAAQYNDEIAKIKAGESYITNLREQTAELEAQHAAFQQAIASGESRLQLDERLAIAAARVKAADSQQADAAEAAARAHFSVAQAVKVDIAAREELDNLNAAGGLLEEIQLLAQVQAGTLSLAEAEHKLAVARLERANVPPITAEASVAAAENIERMRAAIDKSTINLADSFDTIIDGFVDGMLSGTRKGLDAGKLLTDGFKSLFADAFKATIHSKFQFLDQPLSVNLLRDIPAMASQGAGAIVSLFGSAFGKVGSMASSVLGIIGSLFSGGGSGGGQGGGGGFGTAVGTILSGISGVGSLFSGASSIGQAATTAGNVAQLGSAVASGNVGSMVSNTSTMVSLLRGIYNGFSAWTGGASLGGSLNAAFGGILTPLASSITGALGLGGAGGSAVASIAPGFVGFSDAALGAAVVAEGASSSTGAVGISAGTAGGSIAGAASTAGILAAVVAAIEAFLGLSAVEENRKSAFSTADTRKMFMSTFDPFTLAIANFTAMLAGMGSFGGLGNNPGGGSGASNLFGVIQGTMFGGASGLDIAKLAGALAGPLGPMLLPLFAFAAFTKPPTGGTATRVAFEGFLEEKNRKHESRRFAPFFGNVPVLQDGEFIKGNFDRSLGQDFARDFEKRGQGSFSDGLREYIRLQGESIGLGKEQIAQFTALGFAFKATVLGDKGGSQEQRNLATIAAMLGSMAEGGANAVTAMELLRISIGKLGDPAKVFDDLGDALKGGKIAAEDYRAVIQALADLYAGPAPTIKFDLSDKNQKGLDVYKEEIEAINAVFQDLPPGVHAGVRALELLDQTLTDAGEQGVVTFEALNERLQQAVRSVELLNPLVANFRQTIEQGAAEAIKNGTQEQLLDDAVDAFVLSAGRKIQDMVTSSIVEGFLRAQIDTGALAGFFDTVDKAFKEFQAGPQDATALDALTDTLQDAGLAAVATIETLTPALRQLGLAIFNIGEAFDAALDVTTSSTTDAIGLATAVVQLDAAHRQFQNDIDARIFALRNQGKASPEILKRDLPDIAKEFQLTQLGFFGSLSDVIRAGQTGLINPDEIESYVRRTAGGPDEPTSAEKAAALVTLKDLAEKDLAIRIAAIEAETAAVIEGHQERIADLQEERAAIQEASQAAIEARQEELELIQESIAKMQAWKGLLDTTQDTLLTLRGQFESPQQQLGNLRERFEKALVDFNTIDTAHPDFSDEQRIAAGQKLNELGPQLLQLAQQSGLAQSSEAYRILYDLVTDALDRVAGVAGSESAGLLDKQQQALDLQREIRDLQKDAAAQLKAIDEQIEAEQDAIVAAQKDAEAKIQKVSENTAGVLEWIRNQEKALYEAQHAELMAKLDAAGVTSVNLEDIQASSLLELQAIRAVLEGKGIAVDATNSAGGSASTGGNAGATPGSGGAAGSTSPGGQAERGTGGTSGRYDISPTDLATWRGLTEQAAARPGTTAFENHLLAMVGRGFDDVSSTGIMGRAFWRGARSRDAQNAVIDATLKKIYDLAAVSPILGFATGGLVRGDRIARVGEAGPELILPLGAALRDREVRRTFEDFFTAATAVPYGDIQRQLRELAGIATFGGGTRAGLLDTLRTLAPTVPLAPAAPVAAPAAPVQIIQNFELNLTLKVDGSTRLDNPAEAVRKLTPELKRALLELLASDATVKAASARASRQAQPPARNS